MKGRERGGKEPSPENRFPFLYRCVVIGVVCCRKVKKNKQHGKSPDSGKPGRDEMSPSERERESRNHDPRESKSGGVERRGEKNHASF